MTQENTPPRPIFKAQLIPHQARFQHQTARFPKAVNGRDLPNDAQLGTDTLVDVEQLGLRKSVQGVCLLSSVTYACITCENESGLPLLSRSANMDAKTPVPQKPKPKKTHGTMDQREKQRGGGGHGRTERCSAKIGIQLDDVLLSPRLP